MIAISRAENFNFLENVMKKESHFSIERISNGAKEDPFKDIEFNEIWKIQGSQLLKKEATIVEKHDKDVKELLEDEYDDDQELFIWKNIPSLYVRRANGDEFFLKGQEAKEILDNVPQNTNQRKHILAIAKTW